MSSVYHITSTFLVSLPDTSLQPSLDNLRPTRKAQGQMTAAPFSESTQLNQFQYLSILVNALAAAGDVLIAATLCINLHFSRTGFSR